MEIDDLVAEANRDRAEELEREKNAVADVEDTFYRTFRTSDGIRALDLLRRHLQVDESTLSLVGRENATINAQRDAMKMVYWWVWHNAERGARRKGDTLVRTAQDR